MLSSLSSTAVAFLFYPAVIAGSSSVVLVNFFPNKEESVGASRRRESVK